MASWGWLGKDVTEMKVFGMDRKEEEILLQIDRAKDVYVPILTRSVLINRCKSYTPVMASTPTACT